MEIEVVPLHRLASHFAMSGFKNGFQKKPLEPRKQRALLQRKRFALERNRQMMPEFAWVISGAALPEKHPKPPQWVEVCIRRYTETAFKRLLSLQPQNGKATMPQLQELLGIGSAFGAMLANPLTSFPSDAPDEAKEMVADLARVTARHVAPLARKANQSLRKLRPHLRPATLPELQANTLAFTRGANSVDFSDGPAKQELYGLLWFFWPMFNGIRPARKLLEAVETVSDQKFGWKTFEGVCSELGIFKGKRGRPRASKILIPQK